MTTSSHLRSGDLHALYSLLGECRDLGDDPVAWRRHLAAGLARLTDADLVVSGELEGCRAGRPRDLGNVPWGLEFGFNPAGWQKALEYLRDDPTYSTALGSYLPHLRREDGIALSRADIVRDADWYHTTEYQVVFRTLGADHTVYTFRAVPGTVDHVHGALVSRAGGRPDFTARQKAIVREAYALVTPLVRGPLARFGEPSPSELPPRVRQVLRCVLEGDGDKQIAARLRISKHTVNQYIKVIFLLFGVQSRPKLLARWIRRGWGARFAWADE